MTLNYNAACKYDVIAEDKRRVDMMCVTDAVQSQNTKIDFKIKSDGPGVKPTKKKIKKIKKSIFIIIEDLVIFSDLQFAYMQCFEHKQIISVTSHLCISSF